MVNQSKFYFSLQLKQIVTFILISFQFISAEEFNLESSLKYALKNNTDIKLSKNSSKIANAESNQARSLAMPKISGFISSRHNFSLPSQEIDFAGQTQTIVFGQDNSTNVGLNFEQVLFEGRVFSALRSAKIYNNISKISESFAKAQIIEKTKKAFYFCLLSKQSYLVIEKSYQRAVNNYNSTKALFDKGNKREFDVIQAESLVAKRKTDMISAEKTLQISKENLKKLIGYPLDGVLDVIGFLDIKDIIDIEFEVIKEQMIKNQPLIIQTKYNLDLMKENVRYTRSQFLPGVYVNGSYGISQNYNNGNYSTENFNLNTYIGVSISLPIFDFANFASLDKARAEYSKTKYNKIDLEQKLVLELKNLFLTYNETKQKIISAQKQLELAIKGQSASEKLFNRGMITQIESEAAELALLQAELQLEQVKFEYLITIASLERSIGAELKNKYE